MATSLVPARQWRENVAELAATLTDDPASIAALVAASDGLCTAILIDNVPAGADDVHRVLSHAIGAPRDVAAPP